jgi:hypothetical protein
MALLLQALGLDMATGSRTVQAKDMRTDAGEQPVAASVPKRGVMTWTSWTSLLFALLQSLCTFFASVNGVRLAIGIGALALSGGARAAVGWLHSDAIRVPMMSLALLGTLLNLVVLWQIRRLRARPAAQWRQQPVTPGKIRMERLQLVLSIVTLVLIAVEEYWHLRWHHHL